MITERVTDIGKRNATLLENDSVRVVVTDKGGMVPEFAFPSGNGWFNTHWQPSFRSNAGRPFDAAEHGAQWGAELLYEIAGNFLCLPNFGGSCTAYGVELQPHGVTANGEWTAEKWGTLDGEIAYLRSSIRPSLAYPSLPLHVTKYDIVRAKSPGHYAYLRVRNEGGQPYRFSLGWHNTIGAPFLSPGAVIDLCGDRFATPPAPSEFDNTARLAAGTEFSDLARAPLANGGPVDLRRVPGMIGYTDFVTGAVPGGASLGWSSVVNPHVGAAYFSVFRGPGAVGPGEIPIYFNDLWMQYGGRPFTPWAGHDGGTDYTFCLGLENATSAYAQGLAYSLEHEELLGHPTTIEIAPGEEMDHVYATFVTPYEGGLLDFGLSAVEAGKDVFNVVSKSSRDSLTVAGNLDGVSAIAGEIDGL